MKKNILFIAFAAIVSMTNLLAQKSTLTIEKRWEKVTEFADKQLPESALKEVEAILEQAQKEKNSVQVIKATVYKMRFTLEKEPDKAPELIKEFEAFTERSTDPTERALLHSMTAELYAQYYLKDQWNIYSRTEVVGFVPADMKEWTKNIYFDKISKHLAVSLENVTVLQETDALKYKEIFIEGIDSRTMQPTLFDFLCYRTINILLQIKQTATLKNPLLNVDLFNLSQFATLQPDNDFQSSIENSIIQTYQKLLAFRIKEKGVWAIIYADLHYLRYLKQHTELENADSLYLSALSQLKKQYNSNEAVVEVIGEIANYYVSNSNLVDNKSYKKKAYDICTEGINLFPNYNRIGMLKNMQAAIKNKSLSISNNKVVKPSSSLNVNITSANIDSLKLTIYKVIATADEYYSFKQNNRNNKLVYPLRTLIETRQIRLKSNSDFQETRNEFDIKTTDYGIYEFCLEENGNKDESQLALGGFTVSDLGYMTRASNSDLLDVYLLDRQSGNMQSNVKVTKYTNKWKSGRGYELEEARTGQTNKNGLCQFPNNNINYSNNVFFFKKGKDQYFSSASNTYYYQQVNNEDNAAKLTLFTDRSLYRPGQTVYFKGIAYFSTKDKQETVQGADYELTLIDANGHQVSVKNFKTNEFGSFAGEFVLPENGLNGLFQLQSGQFSQAIWVEEYKRPTFEVTIEKPKKEVNFDENVTITGHVKGYAGYNIGDAKIKYRVVRRTHRYCWWFIEPDKEIANGTTNSNSDGTFEVSFISKKKKNEASQFRNEQFYTYTVYTDVTDTKGETQQGEQTISVGDKSLFILADLAPNIDKKQPFDIKVSTETLNGEKINSMLKYNLYKLGATDVYSEKLDDEAVFKESEKGITGSFDTKNEQLNLNLSNLASGRYKLVLTTNDAHGKEVKLDKTFVLYGLNDKRPPVKSYTWLQASKTELEVGENAQIHFGTSTKNTFVLYEIMLGNKVLETRWIPFSDEIKTFDIQFKESYDAGVTVMFTFMKDEQLFTQQIQLQHKIKSKKLTPALSVFRNKLLPGEKAEWTVSVADSAMKEKVAELMVSMYDASLDVLHPHQWNSLSIYRNDVKNSPSWSTNDFQVNSDYFNLNYPHAFVPNFVYDQLNWFGLSMSEGIQFAIRSRVSGVSIRTISDLKQSTLNEVVTVGYGTMKKVSMSEAVTQISPAKQGLIFDGLNVISKLQVPLQLRTNFNETAFFYTQLRTDAQGNVKFTFTAPESLTRWNVKMLAHTKDLYFGQGESQVVTQKDLMVQMNLPRFVRRSDKLVLSANVINLTDKELVANVQFELIDPATEKVIFLKKTSPKTVTLAAKETKAVEWEVSEFSPYELVICKVVAQAGNFSDGEQKYLPVLPDKVLLTESMPMTIRGNETRTFSFGNLLKNGSKVDTKNLSVEFSSNPAWYAVQSLPTISTPENDNALDYFTAYYANSLAAFIANSTPKIAATFDQWKKAGGSRDALLSNLEKNKELKNMLLEETPWVMVAKDETEQKRQIALLFDLNMQKNQAQQYLDKLVSLQMPSGGFTWFKGMTESRYITQEIMLNLARLKRMTGTVNCQLSTINSALNYLDLEIAHDFDNLKKYNKNYDKEMSIGNMQLFYLHLRSEYPEVPVNAQALEAVKFYTAQSEKYWTDFSLYGKAMMAVVANRNGKAQLANDILKSLKENALKTDEFGMYWAKNIAGYFWNERPISVQAAIIEAFTEVSKNAADVDEMKIWLLKQKQTQRWDSPMATVDAVYALLNRGNDWLSNEGSVQLTVGNTVLKPRSTEAGTGYFKETIPVANVRSEMGKVTVSKSNKNISWGAMYWQYYQDLDKIQGQSGPLKIAKKLFVEKITSTGKNILPIEQAELKKGDKIITRLVITTDRNLEFVALKDLRASCFEPVNQLSGCDWKEGVCYYQTTKDASTQFFFSYLPKGTYVFEYELWANAAGEYTSGIASVQCQYAPEFVSHTGGERITIR